MDVKVPCVKHFHEVGLDPFKDLAVNSQRANERFSHIQEGHLGDLVAHLTPICDSAPAVRRPKEDNALGQLMYCPQTFIEVCFGTMKSLCTVR